jgi:ABC-2 type transport system ATP-binding protein
MTTLSTHGITKTFGTKTVLEQISILVEEGEIYGFLGLNGAGKTTLIRIVLGMIKPSGGTVELFGKTLNQGFDKWNDIGYLVETPYAYPNLTVADNLEIFRKLRQIRNKKVVADVISKLKLEAYSHVKAKHLSLGNQQRLGIAKALMHNPKLLILDEPINGLDPEGIAEVRGLLKELAANGATILLSSHILGEVAKVANRFAIIHHGSIITELTESQLSANLEQKLIINTRDNRKAINVLASAGFNTTISALGELELTQKTALEFPENITELLTKHGMPPRKIMLHTEDLETYFLRTINNN